MNIFKNQFILFSMRTWKIKLVAFQIYAVLLQVQTFTSFVLRDSENIYMCIYLSSNNNNNIARQIKYTVPAIVAMWVEAIALRASCIEHYYRCKSVRSNSINLANNLRVVEQCHVGNWPLQKLKTKQWPTRMSHISRWYQIVFAVVARHKTPSQIKLLLKKSPKT